MSLAIPVDQPPEPADAPVEACHACGGEGGLQAQYADPRPPIFGIVWLPCVRCNGTGDEPAEAPCAS